MCIIFEQDSKNVSLQRSAHVTPDLINRIGLEVELEVCIIV